MSAPDGDEPAGPVPVPAGSTLVGFLAAVLVGMFITGQARLNGQLGVRLGDGLVAALVSFTLGLIIIATATLPPRAGRRGLRRVADAVRTRRLSWWFTLGGLGGALLVTSQGLTTAVLGTALFTIAVVAGQSTGGLVVDRAGLGPTGVARLTPPRLIGAVGTLAAVVLSVAPKLETSGPGAPPIALALVPLAGGLAIATQQALNGRVAVTAAGDSTGAAESALPAALVNFVVGTLGLLVATAVDVAVRGLPAAFPDELWLYLGGPMGGLFIALSAWVVRRTGVLLLVLGSVAGQVVLSVVLDEFDPPPTGPPGVTTLVGAALALVAAVVSAVPSRSRRREPTARR